MDFEIVTIFTPEYLMLDLTPLEETAVIFEVPQGEDNAGPHHLRRDLFDKKYVVSQRRNICGKPETP